MKKFGVQFGRFTLFPQLGAHVKNAAELYQQIWEKFPEAFQSNPPGTFPGSTAYGRVEKLQFVVQQQPARLDLIFQPPPQDQSVNLAQLDFEINLYKQFSDLADRLPHVLEGTSINRVASYLQLGCTADDPAEANRLLLGTLPEGLKLRLDAEEDFVLQINLPKPSKHSESTRMNYLIKWSVERMTVMMIGGPSPNPSVKNFLVSTVTLDNSNVPQQEPLDGRLSYELLHETFEAFGTQLHSLGIEIKGFEDAH